ncbi:FIG065221: Holliday junction DNA helicase [hydrothermal vent metagenome]|uniref:FIG065221: Holliday junction DNA helicase n=1 Tax=hydrothermal vent metagenome TaxID=652676 RepID=A0A1W1CRL6_9ZZZZ
MSQPLADKFRPTSFDFFVGQEHILGFDGIENNIHSMLLYGPSGCGKTTLANIIGKQEGNCFIQLSAVSDGIKEFKEVVKIAEVNKNLKKQTILFIDEIHRFNKAQQDALLPHIESGLIFFIGATTENPSFSINQALLSRLQVYKLKKLNQQNLQNILNRVIDSLNIKLSNKLKEKLILIADGDARRLLNIIERIQSFVDLDEEIIIQKLGENIADFDKNGDIFYQQLSAFHKSVRGSSPDGALYWFSRMINAGCDSKVIARRLLAIASEDIGNADPRALQICLTAWDVFHRVGEKEGNRALAQAVVYCAISPKSNAVYLAFNEAKKIAEQTKNMCVPNHLCNATTQIMKNEGVGNGYRYDHNEKNAFSLGQTYFPDELGEQILYQPNERGLEIKINEKLKKLRSKK